jgi:hypothetical protein
MDPNIHNTISWFWCFCVKRVYRRRFGTPCQYNLHSFTVKMGPIVSSDPSSVNSLRTLRKNSKPGKQYLFDGESLKSRKIHNPVHNNLPLVRSQATYIQYTPRHIFPKEHFNISRLRLGLSSSLFLVGFPTKTPYTDL